MWELLHANDQYPKLVIHIIIVLVHVPLFSLFTIIYDCSRILFKWEDIMCYKVDFQSMNDEEIVIDSVLDVWCCFLNSLEELRALVSPFRMFCYIETTVSYFTTSSFV